MMEFHRPNAPPCDAPILYRGAGLDGIYLCNGFVREEIDGEWFTHIENIEGLHNAIALHLVSRDAPLAAKEIRFIRNTMDKTQSEIAQALSVAVRATESSGRLKSMLTYDNMAAIYLAMKSADQPPPNTGGWFQDEEMRRHSDELRADTDLTDVERDKLVDYLRRQGRQGNKQQPIVPVAASELLKAADFIATDNERCDHDQQDGGAAAIAAISQQPVHADEDELGDGSDFGVTGEWWGNADEVERALIRVGQDLEAAKRDGLTTNTLFNIADVRTLRAALLVSNRSGVEQRVREAFYEGFYSAEANSSSVAWHWKNSDARAALDTEKEK